MMSSRAPSPKSTHLRKSIASLAARMMAEDGISDFGFAKRKAARQLGASASDTLPNNHEVEDALRSWQALYQNEEQPMRIEAMRHTALALMAQLQPFNPYLTGGALDGTAGRYTELEIDLYCESAKDVEIFLINHNINYQYRDSRRQLLPAPEALLSLEGYDFPVRLTIYHRHAERNAKKRDNRANFDAVHALLHPQC